MPMRLTRIRAAAPSQLVRGDTQASTATPRKIDTAGGPSKAWSASVIHRLSASLARPRTIEGVEWAIRAMPPFGAKPPLVPTSSANSVSRSKARSSEHSTLAGLAGQPAPLTGLSQTWGA